MIKQPASNPKNIVRLVRIDIAPNMITGPARASCEVDGEPIDQNPLLADHEVTVIRGSPLRANLGKESIQ